MKIGTLRHRHVRYLEQSQRERVRGAGIPPLVCPASRPMLSLRTRITMTQTKTERRKKLAHGLKSAVTPVMLDLVSVSFGRVEWQIHR